MLSLLKKVFILLIVVFLPFFTTNTELPKITPDDIMESVIIVNGSSGVVVYSDIERSFVLTAFHVIAPSIMNGTDILVGYLHNDNGVLGIESFYLIGIDVDIEHDLAILEIKPDKLLMYSDIADDDEYPKIGEDIFLGSNPNHKYRSLKKGIISSKDRFTGKNYVWEVSGGIVFGSSGGGAFTSSGKLFGVIQAVDAVKIKCWEGKDETGKEVEDCLHIPVYEIGFVAQPETIKKFILNGIYSDYFLYLR